MFLSDRASPKHDRARCDQDQQRNGQAPPVPRQAIDLSLGYSCFGDIVVVDLIGQFESVVNRGFTPARAFVSSALRAGAGARRNRGAALRALIGRSKVLGHPKEEFQMTRRLPVESNH